MDSEPKPTESELLRRLDVASRKGSVAATKLLLEELRRDDGDDDTDFDRLDAGNVSPIRADGA